jgi:Family of unknown function (DUF6629)
MRSTRFRTVRGSNGNVSFSMTADLVAGTALLPVAALSLREVKYPRELPFALLPTIFSLHQFIEAAVWAGQDGDRSVGGVHLAVLAYVLIALVR